MLNAVKSVLADVSSVSPVHQSKELLKIMLNAVKSVLADVSSVSPLSEQRAIVTYVPKNCPQNSSNFLIWSTTSPSLIILCWKLIFLVVSAFL